jgi:hypothetical protein
VARLIAFADALHPAGGHEEAIIDDFNVALGWRVHGWRAYELLASGIWLYNKWRVGEAVTVRALGRHAVA